MICIKLKVNFLCCQFENIDSSYFKNLGNVVTSGSITNGAFGMTHT